MNLDGMTTNFIYEEFHQNDLYDLEQTTKEFLEVYFDTDWPFYDELHSKDARNHEEINDFKSFLRILD